MYLSLSPLQFPYLNKAFSLNEIHSNIINLKPKLILSENSFKNRLLILKKTNPDFYKKLMKIKKSAGVLYSEKYLKGYLEEYNLTFKDLTF